MALGVKTGGRKAGTPNKITASARQAFADAFEAIGGGDGLAVWAKSHRTEFYRLFARLIPVEIEGPGPNGEHLHLMVEIIGNQRGSTFDVAPSEQRAIGSEADSVRPEDSSIAIPIEAL